MKINLGSNTFEGRIPILWGRRALYMHADQTVSVVYLGDSSAYPEIVKNEVADGIPFSPHENGFVILDEDESLYKCITTMDSIEIIPLALELPMVRFAGDDVMVGGLRLSGSQLASEVGVIVEESGGIGVGARIPERFRKHFSGAQ